MKNNLVFVVVVVMYKEEKNFFLNLNFKLNVESTAKRERERKRTHDKIFINIEVDDNKFFRVKKVLIKLFFLYKGKI